VTSGASLPGPPPRPPADLDRRALPLYEVRAGTVLYRMHRRRLGALFFGPRTDLNDRGRWDAPDDSFGICYLAEAAHTAFAETMLRELDRDQVSEVGDLAPRSLARLVVEQPLRLARMHGAGLRRMKATAAVVQGPYEITWEWSRAIHGHPEGVAGISYRARHDDDGLSIALFQREESALRSLDSTPLLDPSLAADLGAWLDRYDIGLSP
jgi:hypothetical protein